MQVQIAHMKKLFLPIIIFLVSAAGIQLHAADSVFVYSPNRHIKVIVRIGPQLSYSVYFNDAVIIQPSFIDLQLTNGAGLTKDLRIKKTSFITIDSNIVSPVPERRRNIPDHFNQLTIDFKQPFLLQFKAYDDGVAYRIGLKFKDSVLVKNELADIHFLPREKVLMPRIEYRNDADSFHTSFEGVYDEKQIDSLDSKTLTYSPVLVTTHVGIKIGITESDLDDYPGMFLRGTGNHSLTSAFAAFPMEQKLYPGDYPQWVVTRRENFIAKIKGTRLLPWRAFIIAQEDKELPSNDLVYKLAAASKLPDVSWVHPGKCTDEWIIGLNLFEVPFKAGLNTASYLYYIDFARRFGFDRIMMDAGWSDTRDLFKINPAINMESIIAYAKEQGIKLSMWTLASTLDRQLDSALDRFNKWGVDFIMTDFMDRDDQQMVRFYQRITEACAKHKLMIMFHGAYPPKGFNRTWPNNITREGVMGSEFNIWSNKVTPDHDVTLPFTRMLAGPFDYEPGYLNNANRQQFRMVEKNPESQGTRCHQLAMFVVYDNPLQIFSGNPSQANREPAFMQLLGSLPTIWDETIIVDAKVGDYIVTARRHGNDWYIGGMTGWNAREINLPLSFLGDGRYDATFCTDGVNADNYASDYSITFKPLTATATTKINMAPGGGFLIKLVKN